MTWICSKCKKREFKTYKEALAHEKTCKEKRLEGLGGWLNFYIAVNFIGLVIIYGLVLFSFIVLGMLPGLVYLTVAVVLSMPIIYTLSLMFKKDKSAPTWAIITVWYNVFVPYFVILVLRFYSINIPDSSASSFLELPWAIFWNIYWVRSKRVKNTFVK